MKWLTSARLQFALYVAFISLINPAHLLSAPQVLVADRLSDRVLRYDTDGNLLGELINDPNNLTEPNGLALSPDRSHLYVSSRQNSSVVRYDFDGTTASNPAVIISSGIDVPASLLFSEDGQTLFVANLGTFFNGSTVAQFDPNGVSAGGDLTGGSASGRTGLAFDPAGNMMVSAFQEGAVLKYNQGTQAFEYFIGPDVNLLGTGNLLVVGNDLYVASLSFFDGAGTVIKFNATTGSEDLTFNPILDQDYPASLSLAPDGSGFLLGILGVADGSGRIDRYSFDGDFLGTFANNSSTDPNQGFIEAAGLLTIFDSADFNTDGDVDGVDLAIWEGAYGTSNEGDANFDGRSDGLDFLIWQQQVTIPVATLSTQSTVVPEPASGLLAIASTWLACRSRGRRSRRTLRA